MDDQIKKKAGRPKAKRKFRWNGIEWQENVAYDPDKFGAAQPPANWVSAMGPEGKPVPSGESHGVLPDPMKFLPVWQAASCIEDVRKKFWYCSDKQLRAYRSTLNGYLEPKGFRKLKILRSSEHLFGSTKKKAGANIKKLLEAKVIHYVSVAEREAAAAEREAAAAAREAARED